MFQKNNWENTHYTYRSLKESLLKKPSGFLYIKESKSYGCPECGDLVKVGVTTNWNNRDRVYKKTEVPYSIEDVAIVGVVNIKLSKFDNFIKETLINAGFHCAHADSTEFFQRAAGPLLISLFTAGFENVEIHHISPKYHKYCRDIIDYDDGDTQLLFPSI